MHNELGFGDVIDHSSAIFNDNFLHGVHINIAIVIARMVDGEKLALEDVLSHDYFVPLTLNRLGTMGIAVDVRDLRLELLFRNLGLLYQALSEPFNTHNMYVQK